MEYAIIKTGGKQYRVSVGDMLDVEKLAVEPGSEIELDEVVALSKDGKLSVGQPLVEGAKVVAQVHEHNKDKKIRVFKYKRKTRYRKTTGHRQNHTRLQVVEIQNGGAA
jgi:large subunit ribosomal protein L21